MNKCNGLYPFLIGVLSMFKDNIKISCSVMEEKIGSGIATFLYDKYAKYFENCGLNADLLNGIDAYYKLDYMPGEYKGKFVLDEEDGLILLYFLVLNK